MKYSSLVFLGSRFGYVLAKYLLGRDGILTLISIARKICLILSSLQLGENRQQCLCGHEIGIQYNSKAVALILFIIANI